MDTFRRLVDPAPWRTDWGVAVLRVVVGFTFFMHGWQKLFEFGFAGVTGAFTQMGVPLPGVTAPLVTVVELVGGALLVIGLLTRPAASVLAIDMLGALLLVHLKNGYYLPNGVEFVLLLLAGAVAIILTGPGALAVDRLIVAARPGSTPDAQSGGWAAGARRD